jgi:hypothetical protein
MAVSLHRLIQGNTIKTTTMSTTTRGATTRGATTRTTTTRTTSTKGAMGGPRERVTPTRTTKILRCQPTTDPPAPTSLRNATNKGPPRPLLRRCMETPTSRTRHMLTLVRITRHRRTVILVSSTRHRHTVPLVSSTRRRRMVSRLSCSNNNMRFD